MLFRSLLKEWVAPLRARAIRRDLIKVLRGISPAHTLEAADDIADCVEEAAFYSTLLSDGQPAGRVRPHVRRIARLVLAASREYLRAAQWSVELRRGGPREDMDGFLTAVHRAVELEHETDEAQRAVHEALVGEGREWGAVLFVVVELTRAFEEAADRKSVV